MHGVMTEKQEYSQHRNAAGGQLQAVPPVPQRLLALPLHCLCTASATLVLQVADGGMES